MLLAACLAIGVLPTTAGAQTLSPKEQKRKEKVDRCDVLHLRDKTQFVVEHTNAFLRVPGGGYPERKTSPLVQYDIRRGTRKVICYYQVPIFEKYGYWCGAVYGMEVSNDGSFVVIVLNGAFTDSRKEVFGHPSLAVITIPEEERR